MNNNYIKLILDNINKWIYLYNNKSDLIDNHIKSNHNLLANFVYERTIAAFLSNEIEKLLEKTYKIYLFQEFQIRRLLDISRKSKIDIANKLSIKNELRKWNYFVPDTYINIQKDNNCINEVFIEYKTNNTFKYIDLAIDFLKYLVYMNSSKNNSTFMYIFLSYNKIENKNERRFENINKDVVYLTNKMSSSDLTKNNSIFIYDMKKNKNEEIRDLNFEETSDKITKIENEIIKLNEIINYSNIEFINYNEQFFYIDRDKYGTNVMLESKIIKFSYDIIKKLYLDISNNSYKESFLPNDSYIKIIDFKLNKKNIDSDFYKNFIKNSSKHYYNECEIIFSNKIDSAKYKIIKRRSAFIVACIQAFIEVNNLKYNLYEKIKMDKYYTKDIFKSFENMVEDIKKAYSKKDLNKNLNQLALGLIYFIYNLYEISMSKNDKGFLEEKESIVFFKLIKKIEKDINSFLKLIKLKRKYIFEGDFIDSNKNNEVRILTEIIKMYG